MTPPPVPLHRPGLTLRRPRLEDGPRISDLIENCPPLDVNSRYHALVQCDHFAETCVVAERDGQIIGWISGHIIPGKDPELFIWQVAVSSAARGEGLARRMLDGLVGRDTCRAAALKTTITSDNEASWALFSSFAETYGYDMSDAPHYERNAHFDGAHATEHMVTISLSNTDKKAA